MTVLGVIIVQEKSLESVVLRRVVLRFLELRIWKNCISVRV